MNAQTLIETRPRGERHTRSELVFAALVHVPNRYQLCQLTAKGARKLHKPYERMQDTVNQVLRIFEATKTVDSVLSTELRTSAKQIPTPESLHPALQANPFPDTTRIAMSKAVFMPEERNFSHV